MIYENVELHNIEEVHTLSNGGLRLQRVPEPVRLALNEGAQVRMLQPDGGEIRFLADGPVRVTLSSEGESRVTVFHGLFDGRSRYVIGPEPQTIEIHVPETLFELRSDRYPEMSFAPQVYRLLLGGPQREPLMIHGIEGDNVRPPPSEDLPSLRYLAYGTSITHGFDAEGPQLTYVAHAARILGADLINLGVGGSAHCEPELADYIADRKDWQIATLALSVNMHEFPMDVFCERVSYMVNAVAGADPERTVACITLYPFFRDLGIAVESPTGGRVEEYRQALRDAVAACPSRNAHLLEGPEILTDLTGLTADLIHPSDFGMAEMGRNLASLLKPMLRDASTV
jgi:lysophospholipase L1-like esterase